MPSATSDAISGALRATLDAHPSETSESPASLATEAAASLEVCRKLRTKFAFLPLVTADNEPIFWQSGDSSTAVYWCLRTMECAGTDGGLAHASLCRGERECYARRSGEGETG